MWTSEGKQIKLSEFAGLIQSHKSRVLWISHEQPPSSISTFMASAQEEIGVEKGRNESIRTIVSKPLDQCIHHNSMVPGAQSILLPHVGCIFWRNCDWILVVFPWHLLHAKNFKNFRCHRRPVLPHWIPLLSISGGISETRREYPHCRHHFDVLLLCFAGWYNGVYLGQYAQVCSDRSNGHYRISRHGVLVRQGF